jgi:hypothetical protein
MMVVVSSNGLVPLSLKVCQPECDQEDRGDDRLLVPCSGDIAPPLLLGLVDIDADGMATGGDFLGKGGRAD